MVNVQAAIESLYQDRCTIQTMESVINALTKLTTQTRKTIITDQPCRISYKSINTSNPVSGASEIVQTVVLIVSPSVSVPPGSTILVTHKGTVTGYTNSGKPAVYSYHQEIILDLVPGWS